MVRWLELFLPIVRAVLRENNPPPNLRPEFVRYKKTYLYLNMLSIDMSRQNEVSSEYDFWDDIVMKVVTLDAIDDTSDDEDFY